MLNLKKGERTTSDIVAKLAPQFPTCQRRTEQHGSMDEQRVIDVEPKTHCRVGILQALQIYFTQNHQCVCKTYLWRLRRRVCLRAILYSMRKGVVKFQQALERLRTNSVNATSLCLAVHEEDSSLGLMQCSCVTPMEYSMRLTQAEASRLFKQSAEESNFPATIATESSSRETCLER